MRGDFNIVSAFLKNLYYAGKKTRKSPLSGQTGFDDFRVNI